MKITAFILTLLAIIYSTYNIKLYGDKITTTKNITILQKMEKSNNQGKLPKAENKETYEVLAEITAYTLSEDETDATPEIGACGNISSISFNAIACPRNLSCGTYIQLLGKTYRCWDRMALKNDGMFDILMDTKQEAFKWGKREIEISIIKN